MKQGITKEILPPDYVPNLSDFAFFLAVMKNKEAYRAVLSLILDDDELELTEVKVEQVVLNESGKRAIRLDAWAMDNRQRQINTEMQNDVTQDDVRKRSRYYQGLLDSPILKSGKETRYKHLPETIIIFITQEDIFEQDSACYTFTEQCEEIEGLHLQDGTTKMFLNMSSKNGREELISLLQYMKDTRNDNPDITVEDERISRLQEIVSEVRQSEEWEEAHMSILKIGIEHGMTQGVKALIETCKELGLSRQDTQEKIIDKCNVSHEDADQYMEQYWN